MRKINRLTAEQEAWLPKFRAEYLAHGLSTEPADRPRAEAAFARAYRRIDREPVSVVWVDSPLTASLAIHFLRKQNQFRTNPLEGLADSLSGNIRVSIWVSIWAGLGNSLLDNLGESLVDGLVESLVDGLGNGVRDNLGESLMGNLGESLVVGLGSSLESSLMDSLEDSIRRSVMVSLVDGLLTSLKEAELGPEYTHLWGQHDLYWIALYRFCAEIGLQYAPEAADGLDIMHEIGLSCMWWYPFEGLIVACERPAVVCMDEESRLHSETGPAVSFRDGWQVHAVHGVRVPGWIIESPEKITVEEIEKETNSEIQRVMIERMGWEVFVEGADFEVVDHDERWGTLFRRGEYLVVRVMNSSPEPDGSFRHYMLPVAPGCEPLPEPDGELGEPQALTALNAVASTFGMRGEEYAEMLGAES